MFYANSYLGTFDIQNITTGPGVGSITIHGMFSVNTRGYFIVASSLDFTAFLAVVGTESPVTVSGLESSDVYRVLVYDLDEEGLPEVRPAVMVKGVAVTSSDEGTQTCIYMS